MDKPHLTPFSRRALLGGVAAVGVLALPGCVTYVRWSIIDAVRRLLERASRMAFARLVAPGGFWDSQVARIDLPGTLGARGDALSRILTSALFRDRLQHQLNIIAEDGARRAAPIVADTVRIIGIGNAMEIVRGGPTAATAFLRAEMANSLIDAMIPALGESLRLVNDPLMGEALSALAGVDVPRMVHELSAKVDDVIWAEIGRAEALIRNDPRPTNDEALIGTFGRP